MRPPSYWIPLFLVIATSASTQISVNVNLVVLHATVQDRNGRSAPGLEVKDFAVFEEGTRQTLQVFRQEDTPVTAGLVVDHSGSMRGRLSNVVSAARTFVRLSSADDEMFVVNFNDFVRHGLPPAMRFSHDPEELARAIGDAPAEGKTALYDAIAEGLAQVIRGTRQKRVLIVVSDGGDNASRHTLAETLQLAIRAGAVVYTIGIFDEADADRNPGVLRKLARATGGEAFFPAHQSDIVAIGEQIAREIRQQYTLGYVSNRTVAPGSFRGVHVTASAPGYSKLVVRTRAGYYAGAAE